MKEARHKLYRIEELLTLQDDGNRWLVNNMIPRIGKTIVYGQGGTFKTTILFDLAIGVASGGALLRQFPIDQHGPVMLVSTESSKYANRDRLLSHIRARESLSPELQARGGRAPLPNTKEMPIFFCHQAFDFDDMLDRQEFEVALEEIMQVCGCYPAYMLLDPLDSFISGDENSAKETKAFRKFGDHLVEKYETSLCVIHHSTKDKENPSIRGSGAWRGWTDAALFFQKKYVTFGADTLHYVDVVSDKQRDGREGHIFSVIPEFDAVRRMTTFTLMQEGLDPDFLTRSVVNQRVMEIVQQSSPITQKDIIDITGFTYKRVKAALEHLMIDGVIAQDVSVERATSSDGSRSRSVPAWRATSKISYVDQAAALLRAQQLSDEADERGYQVDVVGPVPLGPGHDDSGHSN
jgi:hypothetical protein